MTPSRDEALALIDAANSEDPNVLSFGERRGPRSLIEGQLASEWVTRLQSDPPDELVIAARAHHLRRWTLPRTDFPAGRAGYLRWRRRLYDVQAQETVAVLSGVDYPDSALKRVADLVAKRGLARDPEARDRDAQTLEDALCLVFIETQLTDFAAGRADDEVIEIIRKTWAKMSTDGHAAALALAPELDERTGGLVARALA